MKPEKISSKPRQAARFWACLLLTLLVGSGAYGAFESLKVVRFSIITEPVGEGPASPIAIFHDPLVAISPVTRLAIIQGAAGTTPQDVVLEFPFDFTPVDPDQAGTDTFLDITFRYRITPVGEDVSKSTITQVGPVRRLDPSGFVFTVPSEEIDLNSVLDYRVEARMVRIEDGVEVERAFSASPVGALDDQTTDDDWWTVGVLAQAAAVIGPDGGHVMVRDGNRNDGEFRMDVPLGQFGSQATVSLDELPKESHLVPSLDPNMEGPFAVAMSDSQFSIQKKFRYTLLYQDFLNPFGQGGLGPDGLVDGTNINEKDLTVVAWDPINGKWIRVGGKVDPETNTISFLSERAGLFAVVMAPPLTPAGRRPDKKIVTPNGDGKNDSAVFDLTGVAATVEIFDMSNHRIRSLSGNNQIVAWDGRDDSGKMVESGVYLYQYKVEGQRISGVIGVAK